VLAHLGRRLIERELVSLELSSRGWRGVTMTPKAVAQIERARRGQAPRTDPTSITDRQEVVAA
jgi:hypothetical protein